MNPLLPLMKAQQALGFDDQFQTSESTVVKALEKAFVKLVKVLTPPEKSLPAIVFSADSFDESMEEVKVEQEDLFVKQITLYNGHPNVKICHMRHYSTFEAAHWHALFAETDETGNFIRIIATDSRTDKKGLGITAKKILPNILCYMILTFNLSLANSNLWE